MRIVLGNWEVLRTLAKRFGPYLLVEAVMPGGTLLALVLYLYRARRGDGVFDAATLAAEIEREELHA